jgi:PKD repeat protein
MIKVNNLLKHYLTVIAFSALLISSLVAKAADCDSINDPLTSKFRFLGEWDSNGSPLYLEPENDMVSEALINYVNATLPESVKVPGNNDDYFGDDVQLNTELQEASKVYLTMVHEGAGWQNTLGFYTYDIANPPQTVYDIDSLVVLFPNVSQPNAVQPGNKILLGEFPAETGIGYFLIAQGWVGDTICLTSHMVFTDKQLNTFTTAAYQQQTILLNYEPEEQILLCFEDIKRPGGDNDFNDAVFYVTAEPGAIDTTNIPKIPTAHLSGDTTLCDENALTELELSLTGKAPWSVTITNGTEEQTFNGITENTIILETVLKDSIWIKTFSDVRKTGISTGFAIVNVSFPKATLDEEAVICNDIEQENGFIVQLEGIAPFSLTYSVDGTDITVENLFENKYALTAEVGANIQLISMTDKYCTGDVNDGTFTVKNVKAPSLVINGPGALCGEGTSTINLTLNGEGPWTINYLFNEEAVALEVESVEYAMNFESPGTIQFQSITDANCSSELNDNIEIQQKPLPTALIEDYQSICGDESAKVTIALGGEGPWTVEYLLNNTTQFATANEAALILDIQEPGLFELVGIQDAYCENIATGTQQIEIFATPTALITGDASICDYEEATVQVALTGTAPFTFIYTDGENETSVTTDESLYEFTSSEFLTYTLLSISDAYCDGTVDGTATISDGSEDLNVEIDAEDNSCFGDEIALSLMGETEGLIITWTTEGNGTLSNPDQLNTSYTPAENETGEIVFYAEVSNGCGIKTVSKMVTIIEELSAVFDISPDSDHLTNTQITFTPDVNGYDEYVWDFGDETESNATIASTEYTKGGIYTVTLTVKLAGCESNGEAELEVLSKDELYIPNAFHPYAQNSENQVVKVYGNNIDESDFFFKIVNRWGKVMYETRSFNEANSVGWNGVNNNNGEEQETNVFTYIVRGKFIEGESFEKVGTVTQLK